MKILLKGAPHYPIRSRGYLRLSFRVHIRSNKSIYINPQYEIRQAFNIRRYYKNYLPVNVTEGCGRCGQGFFLANDR
ncbi:MAG: hypothetical protein NZ601_03165 [candidate division WOR-3 bacterium]|nr:hypothetical protein [candidate division WOR-3 bacterium]MCX7757568.1 hypothetical protein [candidate division WOR-3 bacterium]MDW7987540.1 hypothetical protein [candidate division WOR-3 bacterium]